MSRDLSKRPTTGGASISATPKIDQQTLAEMMPEVYEELRRLDRAHFFAIFARIMRETLTNYAVARQRKKRGGADPAERALEFYEQRKIDIGALDAALKDLEALDPKQAQIVELRFFIGLTVPEIASLMQISPATVKREWSTAKIWLRRELSRTT